MGQYSKTRLKFITCGSPVRWYLWIECCINVVVSEVILNSTLAILVVSIFSEIWTVFAQKVVQKLRFLYIAQQLLTLYKAQIWLQMDRVLEVFPNYISRYFQSDFAIKTHQLTSGSPARLYHWIELCINVVVIEVILASTILLILVVSVFRKIF